MFEFRNRGNGDASFVCVHTISNEIYHANQEIANSFFCKVSFLLDHGGGFGDGTDATEWLYDGARHNVETFCLIQPIHFKS